MADEKTVEIIIRARNLTADEIAKTRASLSGLGEETEKINRKAEAAGGIMGSLGGKIAAAFTVGSVVSFGKAMLENADALVKMSDRTGITIGAVQELQYIGSQTSVSLEEMTGAINQLQNRLAGGDQSAVAAVKALGLNLSALQGMSADQALYAISGAMGKVGSASTQTQLAMELFGKTGAAILPALKADMDALAAAAPKMASELVRAAADFGDTLEALKATGKVWASEGIGWIAEMGKALGDLTVDADENLGSFWRDHGENEARGRTLEYVRALRELNNELERAGIAKGKDKGHDTGLSTDPSFMGPFDDPAARQHRQAEAAKKLTAELERQREAFKKLKAEVYELEHQYGGMSEAALQMARTSERELGWVNETIQAYEEMYKVEGKISWGVPESVINSGWHYAAGAELAAEKSKTWQDALSGVASTLGGVFQGINSTIAQVMATASRSIDVLVSKTATSGQKMAAAFGGAASIAQQLGASPGATGLLSGAATGAAIGSVIPGIGTAIGAVVGGVAGLVGGITAVRSANKQAEAEASATVRSLAADLVKTYGSIEKVREVSLSVGVDLVGMFGENGRNGLDRFNGALQTMNDRLAKQKALQDELASSESQLEQLRQAQVPTWDRIDGLIKEYGIDLKDAGLQIQQMAANAAATKMINDFEAWTAAGGDARTMTQKMRDQVIKLVEDSRKFGTMIPENMKPIIENLKIIGDPSDGLIGASGTGFLGLGDIKFGPASEVRGRQNHGGDGRAHRQDQAPGRRD